MTWTKVGKRKPSGRNISRYVRMVSRAVGNKALSIPSDLTTMLGGWCEVYLSSDQKQVHLLAGERGSFKVTHQSGVKSHRCYIYATSTPWPVGTEFKVVEEGIDSITFQVIEEKL